MIYSLIIEGLAIGSIYSLAAIGIIILIKTTGTINFAHGDFLMVSTFIAYILLVNLGFPIVVVILITILFAAILGITTERVLVRPLINRSQEAIIIATFGLSYVLQGIASILWTDSIFSFPKIFKGNPINITRDVIVTPQYIGIIITSIVIIVIFYIFLYKTKIGKGLRAISQDKVAAVLMGIKTKRMFSISWAISSILAAIAGILIAPTLFLNTGMGSIVFIAIIASILGGVENIFGAIVGGYVLGLAQTVIPLYIPTRLQSLIPYGLLILILLIKPTGILGRKEEKKV